ncbi:MAG: hypothetical protein HFE63_10965 [Clostridiales bacterium]|nr:hypothetical protein [Clostridiales bacterium]
MKKTSLISLSCAIALTAALCAPVSAYSVGNVNVPYGTPTVDGKIDAAEWKNAAEITLDSTTLSDGWVGGIPAAFGGSLKIMWDDDAVYFAGDIKDDNVINSDGGFGAGDSIQLSIDPEQVYLTSNPSDDRANFYGFGFFEKADGSIWSQTSGAGKGELKNGADGVAIKTAKTSDGWCFEIALPLDLMKEEVKGKAKTDITLGVGSKIGMLFCYLDHNGDANLANAFGITAPDKWGTDGWSPKSHGIVLVLQDKVVEKPAETQTASPATADGAAIAVAALAVSAAAAVAFKKKK